MAKKKEGVQEIVEKLDLAKIADQLGRLKKQIKKMQEEEKQMIDVMKKQMKNDNLDKILSATGEFTAILEKRTSGSLDESGLIAYVRKTYGEDMVNSITELTINEDKLEGAIFNNGIKASEVKPFQSIKETYALKVN